MYAVAEIQQIIKKLSQVFRSIFATIANTESRQTSLAISVTMVPGCIYFAGRMIFAAAGYGGKNEFLE